MPKMNKIRIAELIQSYGADSKRWPQIEQQIGQNWLAKHPEKVQKLLTEARTLDQILGTELHTASDTSLLQARILRAAQNTVQDNIASTVPANDSLPVLSKLANWKSVAATLILTTGIGFGVGQVAAANTTYASAEALLSISMQGEYAEADLYGEGQ